VVSRGGQLGQLPPLTHKEKKIKMNKNSKIEKYKTNFLFQIVKIRE